MPQSRANLGFSGNHKDRKAVTTCHPVARPSEGATRLESVDSKSATPASAANDPEADRNKRHLGFGGIGIGVGLIGGGMGSTRTITTATAADTVDTMVVDTVDTMVVDTVDTMAVASVVRTVADSEDRTEEVSEDRTVEVSEDRTEVMPTDTSTATDRGTVVDSSARGPGHNRII
ncbi:hypothetical protein ZHAS_00020163 [Anopheles sinensis]|uniref:Uncharacterized protein n=1 Tax=Anopheles sinensis TaxID=74873 RepID=A0A084WP39_ANOSI|nr:hypothetical protein ZHAS_00020163 [Anopheles sinensis]